MKNKTLFMLLILFCGHTAAERSLDLSNMNDSDKNKTGLYKLTASEIKALQKWLTNKQQNIKPNLNQNNIGFENKQQAERSAVQATLEKRYNDKLGNTYYKLTNGQVWKQIQSGRITIKKDTLQTITIEPKMMGSWLLKGEGNRGVKVKRIR